MRRKILNSQRSSDFIAKSWQKYIFLIFLITSSLLFSASEGIHIFIISSMSSMMKQTASCEGVCTNLIMSNKRDTNIILLDLWQEVANFLIHNRYYKYIKTMQSSLLCLSMDLLFANAILSTDLHSIFPHFFYPSLLIVVPSEWDASHKLHSSPIMLLKLLVA